MVDIKNAIWLILEEKCKPGTYLLQNKKNYKISDIVEGVNNYSNKKIKIKWLSKKIVKEKIYKFKFLKNWKPSNSKIENVVRIITG